MAAAMVRLRLPDAVERARTLANAATPFRRALLGITGAPGAGKSTLVAEVAARLGAGTAAVVDADAWRLSPGLLAELGRQGRAGGPDTYDAASFVDLLGRLSDRTRDAWVPVWDPVRRHGVSGDGLVPSGVPLVIVEGRFLLLADGVWAHVGEQLTESWFVDVDDETRRRRLAERYVAEGCHELEAWTRTLGVDEANALYIGRTRPRADAVVDAAALRA